MDGATYIRVWMKFKSRASESIKLAIEISKQHQMQLHVPFWANAK